MDNKDQIELIENARQGDKQSLERLAEEAGMLWLVQLAEGTLGK